MIFEAAQIWCNTQADALVGGQSSYNWSAEGVCLNPRDLMPGDLFFAQSDDDIALVAELGAAAAVIPHGMDVDAKTAALFPLLRVECPFEALRTLAKAARFRTHSMVVAVQGFEQRRAYTNAIAAAADTYEAGRHLSASMAGMPTDCDFSVFGFAPALAPDIAVISKPASVRDTSIFSHMPKRGIVMVNVDDAATHNIIAEAKAAGLSNILTFGAQSQQADAYMTSQLVASNGVETALSVLGQEITVQTESHTAPHMPNMAQDVGMLLAAMMSAKLADIKLKRVAGYMADAYMAPLDQRPDAGLAANEGVALLPKDRMRKSMREAVYKVRNMVDTGFGRKR